jgi:hypothetical protein
MNTPTEVQPQPVLTCRPTIRTIGSLLIAQITGISDIAALLPVFGINACMILFGDLQEKFEAPERDGSGVRTDQCLGVLDAVRLGLSHRICYHFIMSMTATGTDGFGGDA